MNFSRRFAMLLAWVGLSSWCFGAVELKEAEITTIKNIVEKDEGGGAQPAKTNDKIYEKAKVTTAAASMAELTFVDSSITRMGANTLFSFQSKERLIKLDQGTVLIHTPPGNGGATVDCGGVTASVTGTTFMASRDKVGNSVFVLLEGAGGMKITVGGTSTTIRPGQAASVGASVASDAGGKTEDKATTGTKVDATGGGKEAGQGKEQEATGKPNPDTSGTGGGKAGGETSGGAGTLPPGNTGGGDAGAGSKSTPSAVAQTPAAAPAPLKTPEIKVFEVDVKKVVQTTPLITGFKTELPSAKKIEATIQVQQAKVAEGKIEKLEVEVVAVSHADGDLLVGAPQVEKEDMKIVNSKETVAEKVESKMAENTPGKGPAGDGLDIATAAGPESGGNNTAVTTARSPKVETPGPQPPANTPPPINPGQTVVQQPAATAPIAVTARVDDASRFYNQANPAFGFSITSGSLLPGHSLVGNFLTTATVSSGVTGSPYAVSLSNTKIVNSAGEEVTSRYNLTTVAGVLNVLKAAQSVAFDSIGSLTFRQEANLVAKALAGEVKVEVVSGPATVTNGKLVANSGTGTVVIRATTSGNDNYNGAFAEQTITLAKAGQSVNFALPTSLTFDQATALGATATGAGSVTYELVNAGDSSKVSISGGQLKALSGTGTVQIRAVTAGDNNYNGAFAEQTITLAKAGQSVNFALPSTPLTYNTGTGLTASALDSGTVSFQVLVGPGTIDGSGRLVATSGTGSVVVRATAAGDQNYIPAFADQTITLAKAGQSVSFTPPTSLTFDQATTLGATVTGAGSVSYELVNPADSSKVSISGGQIKALSGTGTVQIRALTAGDNNYSGAFAEQTITLAKAGQSVSFISPTSLTFDQATTLGATVTGAGSVSYELVNAADSSKVSIIGGQIKALSGTGSVVVRATTAGDQNYNGAFAEQTITLAKAGQGVNFALPTSLTFDQATALGATATGAGSVTYELVNVADSSKVSISGGQLKALSGTGTVQIRAVTGGDNNYDVASTIQTITLAKAGQSVSFALPTSLTFDQASALGATATGAGSVTYELVNAADSSKVSISGGQLKALSGTGTVQIRAVTAGDNNYDVASAIQTIALTKAVQNLGFSASTPLLTGNSRLIPVLGAQTGSPVYSIVERDGRASVDSVGNVSVGKILGADSFTLRADAAGDNNYLAGQKDFTVNISRNIPAVEAANATRQFLILPDATDLAAFDEFFYFTGRASGTTAGPSAFFANSGIGDTDRTLAAPGSSIQLYSGQNWDLFAARKFTASPGSITISPSAGKTETAYYGTTIDLGAANPVWQGTQDPRNSSTSLGFRYLTLNSDYLPVFDETLAGAEPTGFFDSYGALLSPLENFPVWDDVGDLNGAISSADIVSVTLSSGSANWSLVGGTGGITARGLDVVANGSAVQMMTSGDLNLKTTRIAGVSRPDLTQSSHPDLSGENLVLEAKGKVKMGVDATLNLDLPTFAGLPEQQQVRLEAKTDPSGNPLAGNLAVVRTGDSLELRNVTIRGFAETRLEKWNPDTKAVEGRVLISGSAVRDFKIKELVGAAVNADSKIQMMALDANGALAGDMVVGGDDARNRNRLPVKAKIASALAEVGENLPTATAGAMVDAKQIDLAAGNLKFQNANLVAMNAITARANTILVQNSFMTVVRNQGMINMYVQSGLVNQNYGAMVDGRVNFAGLNKFTIGNTVIPIGNQGELTAAYGNALVDINFNNGVPQAGKVNVLKL